MLEEARRSATANHQYGFTEQKTGLLARLSRSMASAGLSAAYVLPFLQRLAFATLLRGQGNVLNVYDTLEVEDGSASPLVGSRRKDICQLGGAGLLVLPRRNA